MGKFKNASNAKHHQHMHAQQGKYSDACTYKCWKRAKVMGRYVMPQYFA